MVGLLVGVFVLTVSQSEGADVMAFRGFVFAGAVGVAAGCSLGASEFVIDPALSSLTATLEASGLSDTDSSALEGFVLVEFDAVPGATEATLLDYEASAVSVLNFNLDGGFLGSVVAEVSGLSVALPMGAAAVGPVAIDGAGDAVFSSVPADPSGAGSYEASGLACSLIQGQGLPCVDAIDLSDSPAGTVDVLPATFTEVDGSTLRVDSSFTLSQPLDPANPGLGTITVDVTLVGFADVVVVCPGDTDGDGAVTALDISTVLSNFGSSSASGPADGDVTGDGLVTALDISEVLSNFGTVCG